MIKSTVDILRDLDERDFAPQALRDLLRKTDLVLTHAVLQHLERRLRHEQDDGVRDSLVEVIPRELRGLTSDCQFLTVKLFRHLARDQPLPEFPIRHLHHAVRAEWLATRLLRHADVEASDHELQDAATRIDWKRCRHANALVGRFVFSENPQTQLVGLAQASKCVIEGVLAPQVARDLLVELLRSPSSEVVGEALRQLRQPWMVGFDCPTDEIMSLIEGHDAIAPDAISTLANWPAREVLLECMVGGQRRDVRKWAVRSLGRWATADDLPGMLALATSDPWGFAKDVLQSLCEAQRRGVLISAGQLDSLYELSLGTTPLSAEHLSELVATRWASWIDRLRSLSADDPAWEFQLQLLAKSPTAWHRFVVGKKTKKGADNRQVERFLFELLQDDEFERLFPPIISLMGEWQVTDSEPRLLELADKFPDDVFEALRRVGGERTREFMLGRISDGPTHAFPSQLAREWLLGADDCADELETMADVADWNVAQVGALSAYGTPNQLMQLAQLIRSTAHPARQVAIGKLGELGGDDSLQYLAPLLLDDDEEIRKIVAAAIERIGSRLFVARRFRPTCLMEATDPNEAGKFVLADRLLDSIDVAGRSSEDVQRLLLQLVGLPHPRLSLRLRPLRHHADPHVVKLVIECMSMVRDPAGAAWLRGIAVSDDHFTSRQAIVCLGKLHATWASEDLAKAMSHPNMNVKKAAATALRSAGTREAVEPIVRWLSTHDNPGFREQLAAALVAIVGDGYLCTLMATLSRTSKPAEIVLLLDALHRHIPLRTVVNAWRDGATWIDTLIDLLVAGDHELKDATVAELASELSREGIECEKLTPLLRACSDTPASRDTMESDSDRLTVLLESTPNDGAMTLLAVRQNLMRILEQLSATESPQRERALELVEQFIEQFTPSERAAVAEKMRELLATETLPPDRLFSLMKSSGGLASEDVALAAWRFGSCSERQFDAVKAWGLAEISRSAGAAQQMRCEEIIAAIIKTRDAKLRLAAIRFGLDRGWGEALFESVAQWPDRGIAELWDEWTSRQLRSPTLQRFVDALKRSEPASRLRLAEWMCGLDDAGVELWALARLGDTNELETVAVTCLASRPSAELGETLTRQLKSSNANKSRHAGTVLLRWPGDAYRQQVLDAYLSGDLGEHFVVRANVAELQRRQGNDEDFVANRRYLRVAVLATGSVEEKLTLLLGLREHVEMELEPQLNAAVRGLPVERVLASVFHEVEGGRFAAISLLGNTSRVPSRVVERLGVAGETELSAWLDMLTRWATVQTLSGPELTGRLIAIASNEKSPKRIASSAINLCGRVSDWAEPDAAPRVLAALGAVADQPAKSQVATDAILAGLSTASVSVQSRMLATIDDLPHRPKLLRCLAELYLSRSSILDDKDVRAMRVPIRNLLVEMSGERDPIRARQALHRLAVDGDASIHEILVDALGHPHSSVRALAHRMLRRVATREEYLDATLMLLSDKLPEFRRNAIRTLSFARYEPAMVGIIALLHDRKKSIDKTARAGILQYGEAALPSLRRCVSHERPDRRAIVAEVIQEIVQATDSQT